MSPSGQGVADTRGESHSDAPGRALDRTARRALDRTARRAPDPSAAVRAVTARARRLLQPSFPYAPPEWPQTVDQPKVERNIGADFDTEWARSPAARVARAAILDGLVRPAVKLLADPDVRGLDRLAALEPPAIFAANHASHLDTPLLLSCLPERFRHRTVVAAAADYFFDKAVKARVSALTLAAFPVDRTTVSRRSIDLATELVADDWSVLIYPEGGRTPDGWGREFRGGAAFLARRCHVPIVPIHLEGTRRILRKGESVAALRRSSTHLTFGSPIFPGDRDTRELSAALERAVAELADEQSTDWWQARRRAARGETPALRGPEVADWRRAWALGEGRRRRQGIRWP